MTIRRTILLAALVFAVFLSLPASGRARSVSPAGRVAEGNKAYEEGRFDDALAAYEQVSEMLSDNAVLIFNKGAALYKKGDYKAAEDAFRESAELADDLKLRARSFYNSGNSAFKQGEAMLGDNLDDALKFCEKSASAYRKSIELDRNFPPVVENLEIARLTMQAIRDEMQVREEERQRQEQLQQEMKERLQEIIEQQQDLRDQTEQAAEEDQEKSETGDQQADDKKSKEKTGECMAEQQASLKDDTRQTAEDAGKAGAQEQLSDRIEAASKHQEQAEEKLKEEKFEEALPEQEKAIEELKQALESMREQEREKSGEPEKQENAGEGGEPREKNQEGEAEDEMEQQDMDMPEDDVTPEEGREPFDQDARGIIEREKQNRAERLNESRIMFEPVERDW